MSTQTLYFNINGSRIESTDVFLAADSINYAVAHFSFDESWNTLYKTAIFRKDENVYHVVLKDNQCQIPFEVLTDGIVYISCFGVFNDTRATTTEIPVQVEKSGYVICTPQEATPDPYNYFLNQVNGMAQGAEESAAKAEAFANSAAADATVVANSLETINAHMGIIVDAEEKVGVWSNQAYNAAINAEESQQIATEAADVAKAFAENSLQSIEQHNLDTQLSHPDIRAIVNEANSIAKGKANSLSFETEEQLRAWIDGSYTRPDKKTTADLNVGDNLYIIELGVPDYWWDGESIQPLGAEKPALLEYVKKEELEAQFSGVVIKEASETEYAKAVENNSVEPGTIYFVYGEEE